MVTRPNKIPIKGAQMVQGWMLGIAFFLGFVGIGACLNGDGGAGFILFILAFLLGYGGSKIKTHKHWRSGMDIYE